MRTLVVAATFFCILGETLFLPTAFGADGMWGIDADGDWSLPSNWEGGFVANGADSTATFDISGVGLSGARTVTLDSDRTIGNISFADFGGNGSDWTLAGANALTLAVTSGTPTINSLTPTTISATLSGVAGFSKGGNLPLKLTSANIYTGATRVTAGVLDAVDGAGLPSASNLTLTTDGLYTTAGAFTRNVGTGSGQVQWAGSAGFAAYGGPMTVKLKDANNANPNVLTWGTSGFVPVGSSLILNGPTSDSLLDFQNDIDLAGGARSFFVPTHFGPSQSTTVISGVISNGELVRPDITSNGTSNAGTLVLTANNSYGNTTLLNDVGRLQVGNGGATGSLGTGTVTITNASLAFNRSDAVTVGNVFVGGTGSTLIQQGSGTVTLSGNAAGFNGNVVASRGTLVLDYSANNSSKIGNALTIGRFTSGSVASLQLSGGNHLEVVASTRIDSTATISRTSGAATLRLNAITLERGASLDISEDNIADTDTLNVGGALLGITVGGYLAKNATDGADGKIVALANADYVDVPHLGGQIVNGPTSNVRLTDVGSMGPVTLAAVGTTTINTLTQAATSGATSIEIGAGNTLRMGSNGTVIAPSGTGALSFSGGSLSGGRIAIHNAVDVTIGSSITNDGAVGLSLTKVGDGRAILTGANSYTGETVVGNGVLQIGDGGTSGSLGTGNVTNHGTLEFHRSDAMTVENMLFGSGAVVKKGAGTVTLTRNNVYGGTTVIQEGTLLANNTGSSATGVSVVTIKSGGTLGGTGAVAGPVVVEGGGRVAPGASIESLGVGSVTFMPTSIASFEIDLGGSVQADLLNVTGSVTIENGVLDLALLNAPPSLRAPLTFLIAANDATDAIVATFASITGLPNGYGATVDYGFLGADSLQRVGTGNDLAVTLFSVPEPGFGPTIGAIMGFLLARNRPRVSRRHGMNR